LSRHTGTLPGTGPTLQTGWPCQIAPAPGRTASPRTRGTAQNSLLWMSRDRIEGSARLPLAGLPLPARKALTPGPGRLCHRLPRRSRAGRRQHHGRLRSGPRRRHRHGTQPQRRGAHQQSRDRRCHLDRRHRRGQRQNLPARVAGYDQSKDIAILKLSGATGLQTRHHRPSGERVHGPGSRRDRPVHHRSRRPVRHQRTADRHDRDKRQHPGR
jgi:hypothetical protein